MTATPPVKSALTALAHISTNAVWAPQRLTDLVHAGHARNAANFVGRLIADVSTAQEAATASDAWRSAGLAPTTFDAAQRQLATLSTHLRAADGQRAMTGAALQAIQGASGSLIDLSANALKLHDALVAQL